MTSTRIGGVHNLYAAFAGAPAAVGALPDTHDRGNPVKPGQFAQVFQRQSSEARREVRRAVVGDEGGWVITGEPAPGGWLLHLWESVAKSRVRVRSVLLPLAPRPAATEPGSSPPPDSPPRGSGWAGALGLILAAAVAFVAGVAAQQYGLQVRTPFTLTAP